MLILDRIHVGKSRFPHVGNAEHTQYGRCQLLCCLIARFLLPELKKIEIFLYFLQCLPVSLSFLTQLLLYPPI